MNELEKRIEQYLKERKWDNLRPSDIAKSITIEGAELLELFQWEGLELKEVKKDKEKVEEIKKELADVFIYALGMSVLLGLNTTDIVNDKLDYIEKKYPAKLMRKHAKKGLGSGKDSEYLRIKKQYRKSKITK